MIAAPCFAVIERNADITRSTSLCVAFAPSQIAAAFSAIFAGTCLTAWSMRSRILSSPAGCWPTAEPFLQNVSGAIAGLAAGGADASAADAFVPPAAAALPVV
ncbi:hypothetical protein AWB81_08096 [Caballeronia arationis]|nr:hypothetical protein AWB81_08096 [Caballeronia arationis]